MRNLVKDLEELNKLRENIDLPDEHLEKEGCTIREEINTIASEMSYGITFTESTVSKEWLERAINAENNKTIEGINNNMNILMDSIIKKFDLKVGSKYRLISKKDNFYSRKDIIGFLKDVRFSYNDWVKKLSLYIEVYKIKKDGDQSKITDGMHIEDINKIEKL
jgi:hypothetical protein